ncbi:MAG: hypothetical protein QF664_08265 [Dehalococcoidia bacterium]|nr:hypothetical protein [Dehalococcoidia bacterium]
MEGHPRFNVEQLHDSLLNVDHALIRLTPIVTQRLLVDFRANEDSGPAVGILPEVKSLQERLTSIERARPGFDRPKRINVIMWPLRVDALERLGVLNVLRGRLAQLDAFDALRQLDEAFAELLRLERDEQRRAITGEGYETIWSQTQTV